MTLNENERQSVERVWSMTLDELDTALRDAQVATPHQRNKAALQVLLDKLDSVASLAAPFVG